ncbi:MAG: flagellar basal body protein [Ilumatobacteraceae bacterium]
MSTALSGLRNHQVMLDVVGNDIANVSTVGFKSSTTVFSDVLTRPSRAPALRSPACRAAPTRPRSVSARA